LNCIIVKKTVILFFITFLGFHSVSSFNQPFHQQPQSGIFTTDTSKINKLILQGYNFAVNGYMGEAMPLAMLAQLESQKARYLEGMCKGRNLQSYVLIRQGNYDSALVILKNAIIIGKALKDSALQSTSLLYLGNAYSNKGDHSTAIEFYYKGLAIEERQRVQPNLHFYFNGIGVLFTTQKNYSKGLEYLLKAKEIVEHSSNKKYLSTIDNNIGWQYMLVGKNDSAYFFLDLSVKASEEGKNLYALTFPLHNLAELFLKLMQYDKVYKYAYRSYEISKSQGFKDRMVANLITLGDMELRQNKFASAENYLLQGLKLSNEIRTKLHIKDVSLLLANLYEKQQQHEKAFNYYTLFASTKDTILNQKNSKIIMEMNVRYSTEKKEKEIELLKKNEEIQRLELAKKRDELETQRMLSISIGGGLLLLLFAASLLFGQYRLKKRATDLLQHAYNIIEDKNTVIERSNSQITDSITYAKRIQDAVLPAADYLIKLFADNFFVLYQPSQIVSGDFYWCSQLENKIILVVADCTGHGVSGAFMSMIGNTILNEIVNEQKETNTSEIAALLDKKIVHVLHQYEGSEQYDGMDLSVCCIDKTAKEIHFTGASQFIYIYTDGLHKIKGDPYTIGGSQLRNVKKFTSQKIRYEKNASLYLLTDGYCDQSGGASNKRFSSRQFETLLLEVKDLPMAKQKDKLEQSFEHWKEETKQRDDILVIGIKC
jgi:serine phosphatase RsbU (regulator of sigma subunit)